MKNVFLIKTPLQLLNAIEARHYYGLHKDDCVLVNMADRKSQSQIHKLTKASDEWGKVIELNDVDIFFGDISKNSDTSLLCRLQALNVFKKSIFYIRRLNLVSKYIGQADTIFMGYTRFVYMTHFINVTPHNRVVFLDDGNGTLELSAERKKGITFVSGFGIKKRIKYYLKITLQRIKDKEVEHATYFTVYDIDPGGSDEVVKNDYSYLRKSVKSLSKTDDVYFVGSPLGEVGIISQDEYLSCLKRVAEYFSDKKLVYIAHRRDSGAKLEFIENNLGINVVLFDYPIEYQLGFFGPKPKILASFYSAALDSCREIFGENLKLVSFKLDVSNSPKREKVESIYESYKSSVGDNFIVESNY